MQTYTVTDNWDVANGTCLQGYITTNYATLVKAFGPSLGEGDKTTQEWILVGNDGTVATIYDWKYGTTPMHTCQWNIGGNKPQAVELVLNALKGTAKKATVGSWDTVEL
jgi:hypothetical protein